MARLLSGNGSRWRLEGKDSVPLEEGSAARVLSSVEEFFF